MSHVPHVVNRIVEHVASEALDGEPLVVASVARPMPLSAVHPGEGSAQPTLGLDQFGGHHRRVLLPVAVGHRGFVLIPIRVVRVVVIQHEVKAEVVEAEHVTNVTGVLERGPHPGGRAVSDTRPRKHLHPRVGIFLESARNCNQVESGGVEPAVVALRLEHPGPVFGLRHHVKGFAHSARR